VLRITGFCSCTCIYVFGCRLGLVRLCDSDFGITPVDDDIIIIIIIVCYFEGKWKIGSDVQWSEVKWGEVKWSELKWRSLGKYIIIDWYLSICM